MHAVQRFTTSTSRSEYNEALLELPHRAVDPPVFLAFNSPYTTTGITTNTSQFENQMTLVQ